MSQTNKQQNEIIDLYANSCFTILGLSQASFAEVNQANIRLVVIMSIFELLSSLCGYLKSIHCNSVLRQYWLQSYLRCMACRDDEEPEDEVDLLLLNLLALLT